MESFLEFNDSLYCNEEEESSEGIILNEDDSETALFSLSLLSRDHNDEDLQSLLSKEMETFHVTQQQETGEEEQNARREAVEWLLKMNAHYGFTPLTAILAVNYLNRFLSSMSFQRDKPWMMQLTATACLSLAAKVEETYVPLLLDLQVEGAKYLFEARTIQRMELLVLSSLKWRMNPVTPLSFLDHIITRLGYHTKSNLHSQFIRNCENLLLFILPDPRFRQCPPSVMAAATILHVIHETTGVDHETELLSILKISKEEVHKCYQLLSGISSNSYRPWKRRKLISQVSTKDHSIDSAESSCVIQSIDQLPY